MSFTFRDDCGYLIRPSLREPVDHTKVAQRCQSLRRRSRDAAAAPQLWHHAPEPGYFHADAASATPAHIGSAYP